MDTPEFGNPRSKLKLTHYPILEQCRAIGFDNLSPIIWYKISNMQTGVYER